MTTPLTPEEVAKIRLPEAARLVKYGCGSGYWTYESTKGLSPAESSLASLAATEANGLFPAGTTKATWALIEGRPLVPTCATCKHRQLDYDDDNSWYVCMYLNDEDEDTFPHALQDGTGFCHRHEAVKE